MGDRSIPMLTPDEIASATPAPRRPIKSKDAEERTLNRSVSHAVQGNLGRAVSTLMRDNDDTVVSEDVKVALLRKLHPKRVEEVLKCVPEGPVEIKLKTDPKKNATTSEPQLKTEIRKWCSGKSPGPSGWTEELIRDSITAQNAADWLAIFEDIVNASLDTDCLRLLRRCNLLGIPKKPSGIRPLAMGETIVKVAVKILLLSQKELFDSRAVGSFQYAFQKCGVEQIIHQVRELIRDPQQPDTPDAAIPTTQEDDAIAAEGPGAPLTPPTADAPAAAAEQECDTAAAEEPAIVPQHAVLVDCSNAFNTVRRQAIGEALMSDVKFNPLRQLFNAFYVEQGELIIRSDQADCPVISSSEGVRQGDVLGPLFFCLALKPAIDNTIQKFRTTYEDKAMPKFFAYMDDVTIVGEESSCIDAFIILKKELEVLSLLVNDKKTVTTSRALAESLNCEPSDCFKLLGAFVGRAKEKEKERIDELPQTHETLFNRLPLLPAEIAYRLLTKCGVPRWGHLIRTHEPEVVQPASTAFTEMSVRCLASILRVNYNHLDAQAYRQIRLPIRHGGLGLIDWAEMCEGAYEASVDGESKHDLEDDPYAPAEAQTREDSMWEDIMDALKEEDKNFFDHLKRNKTKMASRWLAGDITIASSQPSNAFRAAMLFRLRWAGAHPSDPTPFKCRCGFPQSRVRETTTRDMVMHLVGCCQNGGPTKRHHFVRDALAGLMTRAGYSVQTEVVLDPKAELRMDIVATPPDGPVLFVDTTVTNSTSRTLRGKDADKTFEAKDLEKKTRYEECVAGLQGTYMTFALDIYGRMSKQSKDFLSALTTKIKLRCADSASQDAITVAATSTTLSKALAFGNGTCLLYSQQLPLIGVNFGATPSPIVAPKPQLSTEAPPATTTTTAVAPSPPADPLLDDNAPVASAATSTPTSVVPQPNPNADLDSDNDEEPFAPPGLTDEIPQDDEPNLSESESEPAAAPIDDATNDLPALSEQASLAHLALAEQAPLAQLERVA